MNSWTAARVLKYCPTREQYLKQTLDVTLSVVSWIHGINIRYMLSDRCQQGVKPQLCS